MFLIHTFAIQTGIMADTEVKSVASMEFLDKKTELVWLSSQQRQEKGDLHASSVCLPCGHPETVPDHLKQRCLDQKHTHGDIVLDAHICLAHCIER